MAFLGKLLGRVLLVSLLGWVACKGDSTDPGGNNNGSISLAVSAAALSIVQGANGSLTATVGRSGDFSGAITISVDGLPSNVTATASPASIAAGATSTTITFTAAGAAATGNTTVTVRAAGAGVNDKTATVALTITAAPQGSYTVTLNPTTVSVQQGAQGSTTATLARTGNFTGSVVFSATGAPAGMTVSFDPANTTGNGTTVTVIATGAVAANNYTITIRGTATGVADQTATLTVTVTAASAGNTTFRICTENVLFAAVQDGNGPWTAVPVVNSTITFSIGSGRGGVAYVSRAAASTFQTVLFYATQAELNSGAAPCSTTQQPVTKTVNGSVASVTGQDGAYVGIGTSIAILNAFLPPFPNFTLENVPDGLTDLIAARISFAISGSNIIQTANKAIIRRGINPANNSTLPVLDFNAAEAFDPVMRNLTVNNVSNDALILGLSFQTSNGSVSPLYAEVQGVASSTRQFPTLPNAQNGDLHFLSLTAATGSQPFTVYRSLLAYFTAGVDKTFTLGPVPGPLTVTAAATSPSVRLRAQYTLQPEYPKGVTINYNQSSGGTTRGVILSFTEGYLTGSTTIDHTMPDFTGLNGWDQLWGLVQGAATQWALALVNYTGTGALLDGLVTTVGARIGSILP